MIQRGEGGFQCRSAGVEVNFDAPQDYFAGKVVFFALDQVLSGSEWVYPGVAWLLVGDRGALVEAIDVLSLDEMDAVGAVWLLMAGKVHPAAAAQVLAGGKGVPMGAV